GRSSMVQRRLWWSLVLLAAVACGCGQVEEEVTDAPPPEDPPERLGDHINVSLSELLGKPRAELAALADEWTARAQLQEKTRRDDRRAALRPQLPGRVGAAGGAHAARGPGAPGGG